LKFSSFTRSRIGLWLLIACALFSNLLLLFRSTRQLFWKDNNDYAAYQQQKSRLGDIPEILRARHSRIVGYDTDRRPGTTEYFLSQFILAPILVADDPARPLIIGNYHNARGIVLIERTPGQ